MATDFTFCQQLPEVVQRLQDALSLATNHYGFGSVDNPDHNKR
jgi:hypothetical protein